MPFYRSILPNYRLQIHLQQQEPQKGNLSQKVSNLSFIKYVKIFQPYRPVASAAAGSAFAALLDLHGGSSESVDEAENRRSDLYLLIMFYGI